ncbi:MAG: cytochrome b/b6 domain-containing protein [Pseudohongiella sp.]|nr:cytochrome b/b6 domain-containing protein [Pseudohongiella sp.]
MTQHRSLYDQPDSFGWITIALHWTTSIAIIVLWFVGQSILLQPADEVDARRALHITLGLIAWLPLAGRIVWRLRVGHPQVTGQTRLIHAIARVTHYLMLAALSVMIISGPLMAWALPERTDIAHFALAFHSSAALVLLALISLHILGALKHLMFHEDETIARIFVPRQK